MKKSNGKVIEDLVFNTFKRLVELIKWSIKISIIITLGVYTAVWLFGYLIKLGLV